MPVCSYLVFPRPDADDLAQRLAALPGCEVTPADNADLLILLTETPDMAAEEQLQTQLEGVAGIQCLVLTFGDLQPEDVAQAGATRRGRKRGSKERLVEDAMVHGRQ
jgi:nitrate reductase NapAB chaperone NapD